MKLFIDYRVSICCKMVVKSELEKPGLHYTIMEPGEVDIEEDITTEQKDRVHTALLRSGPELMDDKKSMMVEMIKNDFFEMVH